MNQMLSEAKFENHILLHLLASGSEIDADMAGIDLVHSDYAKEPFLFYVFVILGTDPKFFWHFPILGSRFSSMHTEGTDLVHYE